MFENDYVNIQKIVSIMIGYPSPKRNQYPFKTHYSTQEQSEDNELFIYLDGKSIWTLDNTTFEIKKGDIVLIPRNINRTKYTVTTLEPVTFVNIYFRCNDICLSTPIIFRKASESINNKFHRIAKVWLAKNDGFYSKSMYYLYDIINTLHLESTAYLPSKSNDSLKQSVTYMEQNYYKTDFDYTKMAALSGFCYSYFKKQFIKKYGCSPVKHVTNMRINLACELISNSRYKITEIAEMCGFENVQYFSIVFKKTMGITPSQFKSESN